MARIDKHVESVGIRQKLGRPVKDADDRIEIPLVRKAIADARKSSAMYDIDDDSNFTECVLANCLRHACDAEVLIMRKTAYVLLPDAEYTLRYEVDSKSTEVIHLNDERRFDEIPKNHKIILRPPSKRRRLSVMRHKAKQANYYRDTRGSGRTQRTADPMRGVWRHGGTAPDHEI